MKKSIIIATFALGAIVFGINNVNAQTHDATTTVNITLADVISIDALSSAIGGTVNFNYNTAEAYNTDQTVKKAGNLVVTSTKAFDVKVKANGEYFSGTGGGIPVEVLVIKPTTGGTTNMTGTKANIALSIADQTLVAGAELGSKRTLDIDYFISAASASSNWILGKDAGSYTQTVTYTATAL